MYDKKRRPRWLRIITIQLANFPRRSGQYDQSEGGQLKANARSPEGDLVNDGESRDDPNAWRVLEEVLCP